MNPYREIPAAPGPGSTFQVPQEPSEEEATQAAIDYGWLIALAIVAVVVGGVIMWMWRSWPVRIVLACTLVGWMAYKIGAGS